MSERIDGGRTQLVEECSDRGKVGVVGSVWALPTTGKVLGLRT